VSVLALGAVRGPTLEDAVIRRLTAGARLPGGPLTAAPPVKE
jgi:hypothetical protein